MSDTNDGGFLGISPEFARNLLTFGASTMAAANQRTPQGFLAYGSGPLGPIGAGLQGMQQQGMDLAKLRSNIGLQQAQMAHTKAETDLINNQIPLMQQGYDLARQAMDPGFAGGVGGGGFGNGPYGFTGNQSQRQPANVIPSDQREGLARAAVQGTDVPAEVLDALVSHESGWDANARGQKGETGLGQIMADTAHNPGYGVPGVDPNALAIPQNNLKFSAQYLQGIGNKYGMKPQDWNNPAKLAQVLHDYNGAAAPPEYAQIILGKMRQAPSWAPAPYQVAQAGGGVPAAPGQAPLQLNMQGQSPSLPGGMNQEALGRAQQLYAQAARLPHLNLPGVGDMFASQRAALMQQAQEWQKLAFASPMAMAGQQAEAAYALPKAMAGKQAESAFAGQIAEDTAKAKLPYEVHSLRGAGSVLTVGGKPVLQVPMEIHTQEPGTGREVTSFVQPIEGGPPAHMPAPYISKIGPGEHEALQKTAEEFNSEPAIKQYNSAIQTIGWTRTMEDDFNTLNQTGDAWSKTGPGADTRMHIASLMNSGLRSVGLPDIFNPEKVASWEALNKQTKTAGMQLVNAMFGGSREAASIVHSAMGAVPGIENSPEGAKLISAIIRDGAQYQIDRRAYIQQQAGPGGTHPGDYTSPGLDFDSKGERIKQYMTRAISQVRPYPLVSKTPQEFAASGESRKYMPGTFVRSPGGTVFQVPEQ